MREDLTVFASFHFILNLDSPGFAGASVDGSAAADGAPATTIVPVVEDPFGLMSVMHTEVSLGGMTIFGVTIDGGVFGGDLMSSLVSFVTIDDDSSSSSSSSSSDIDVGRACDIRIMAGCGATIRASM